MLSSAPSSSTSTKELTEIEFHQLGKTLQEEIKRLGESFLSSYPKRNEFISQVCHLENKDVVKTVLQDLIKFYQGQGQAEKIAEKLHQFATIGNLDERWTVALEFNESKETKHYAIDYILADFDKSALTRNKEQCELIINLTLQGDPELKEIAQLALFEMYTKKFPDQIVNAFERLISVFDNLHISKQKQKLISRIATLIPGSEEVLNALYTEKKVELVAVSARLTEITRQIVQALSLRHELMKEKNVAFLNFLHSKLLIAIARDNPIEQMDYLQKALGKIRLMRNELLPVTRYAMSALQKEGDSAFCTDCLTYQATLTETVDDAKKVFNHYAFLPEGKEEKKPTTTDNPGKPILIKALKKSLISSTTDHERKKHLQELVALEDKESIPVLAEIECKLHFADIQLKPIRERIMASVAYFTSILATQPVVANNILHDLCSLWNDLESSKKYQTELITQVCSVFERKDHTEQKSILPIVYLTMQEKMVVKLEGIQPRFVETILNHLTERTKNDIQFVISIHKKMIEAIRVNKSDRSIEKELNTIESLFNQQDYGYAASQLAHLYHKHRKIQMEWYETCSRFPNQCQAYFETGRNKKVTETELALAYFEKAFDEYHSLSKPNDCHLIACEALTVKTIPLQMALKFIKYYFSYPFSESKLLKAIITFFDNPITPSEMFRDEIKSIIRQLVDVMKGMGGFCAELNKLGSFAELMGEPIAAIQFYGMAVNYDALFKFVKIPFSDTEEKKDMEQKKKIYIAAYEILGFKDVLYQENGWGYIPTDKKELKLYFQRELYILTRSPLDKLNYDSMISVEGYEKYSKHALFKFIEHGLYTYTQNHNSLQNLEYCVSLFIEQVPVSHPYFEKLFFHCEKHLKKMQNNDVYYLKTNHPLIDIKITLLLAKSYMALNRQGAAIVEAENLLKKITNIEFFQKKYLNELQLIFKEMKYLDSVIPMISKEPLHHLTRIFKRTLPEEKSSFRIIKLTEPEEVLLELSKIDTYSVIISHVITGLEGSQRDDLEFLIASSDAIKKKSKKRKPYSSFYIDEACSTILSMLNENIGEAAMLILDNKLEENEKEIQYLYNVAARLGHAYALWHLAIQESTITLAYQYYEQSFNSYLREKQYECCLDVIKSCLTRSTPITIPTILLLRFSKFLFEEMVPIEVQSKKEKALTALTSLLLQYEFSQEDKLTHSSIIVKIYDFLSKNTALPLSDMYYFQWQLLGLRGTASFSPQSRIDALLEKAREDKNLQKTYHYLLAADECLIHKKLTRSDEFFSEGIRLLVKSDILNLPSHRHKAVISRYEEILRNGHSTDLEVDLSITIFLAKNYQKLSKADEALMECSKALSKVNHPSFRHINTHEILHVLKELLKINPIKKKDILGILSPYIKIVFLDNVKEDKSEIKEADKQVGYSYHQFLLIDYALTASHSTESHVKELNASIITQLPPILKQFLEEYEKHPTPQLDFDLMLRVIQIHISAFNECTPIKTQLHETIKNKFSGLERILDEKKDATLFDIAKTRVELTRQFIQYAKMAPEEEKSFFLVQATRCLIKLTPNDLTTGIEKCDAFIPDLTAIMTCISPDERIQIGNFCQLRRNEKTAIVFYYSAGMQDPSVLKNVTDITLLVHICSLILEEMTDGNQAILLLDILLEICPRKETELKEEMSKEKLLVTQWFDKFGPKVDPEKVIACLNKFSLKQDIIIPGVKKCWVMTNNALYFNAYLKYVPADADGIRLMLTYLREDIVDHNRFPIKKTQEQKSDFSHLDSLLLYRDACKTGWWYTAEREAGKIGLVKSARQTDVLATFFLIKVCLSEFRKISDDLSLSNIKTWLKEISRIQEYVNLFYSLTSCDKMSMVAMQFCVPVADLTCCRKWVTDRIHEYLQLAIHSLAELKKNVRKEVKNIQKLDELDKLIIRFEIKKAYFKERSMPPTADEKRSVSSSSAIISGKLPPQSVSLDERKEAIAALTPSSSNTSSIGLVEFATRSESAKTTAPTITSETKSMPLRTLTGN